jgi:hypothetical protein
MTESSGCQVRELLPASLAPMDDVLKQVLCKNPDIGPRTLAWGFVGSEATDALRNVLDCDVFELVAQGWCVAKELQEYSDPARHPPGERSIVYLGKHSFVKTVHPVLDVMVESTRCASLRFTLELAANFRSVALSISDGRITGAGAGDGDVGIELKYGEVTLLAKETRKVPFPARIDFKAPGLLIARAPETKAQGSR